MEECFEITLVPAKLRSGLPAERAPGMVCGVSSVVHLLVAVEVLGVQDIQKHICDLSGQFWVLTSPNPKDYTFLPSLLLLPLLTVSVFSS